MFFWKVDAVGQFDVDSYTLPNFLVGCPWKVAQTVRLTALVGLLGLTGNASAIAESAGKPSHLPVQVDKINTSIAQIWKDYEIKPSPTEDDLKWCRRVFLDLIGRIPSYNELQEYTKDRSDSRKLNLVTRLLEDDRYTEEYANNWSTIWTNILIGRNGGMERRTLVNRDGMQKYFADCF